MFALFLLLKSTNCVLDWNPEAVGSTTVNKRMSTSWGMTQPMWPVRNEWHEALTSLSTTFTTQFTVSHSKVFFYAGKLLEHWFVTIKTTIVIAEKNTVEQKLRDDDFETHDSGDKTSRSHHKVAIQTACVLKLSLIDLFDGFKVNNFLLTRPVAIKKLSGIHSMGGNESLQRTPSIGQQESQ